jgi:DNA-binding SARP family transcriptional activator
VRAFIQQAELLGLLSRRGESTRWSHRYHPLIRDYLLGKLADELDRDEVAEIHRAIAREAEATSWAVAAHHWLEAGDITEMVQAIERQIAAIASSGQYSRAAWFLDAGRAQASGRVAAIVRARIDLHAGRFSEARDQLQHALGALEGLSSEALQVLMSIAVGLGEMDDAARVARFLLRVEGLPDWQAYIAKATIGLRDVSLSGRLDQQISLLETATAVHEHEQRWQLAAISRYNLADARYYAGEYENAATDAKASIDYLGRSGGDANEVASAFGMLALTMLALNRRPDAETALAEAQRVVPSRLYEWEVAIQRAECLADFGRLADAMSEARQAAARVTPDSSGNARATIATLGAAVATKCYDLESAREWLLAFDATSPSTQLCGLGLQRLTRARLDLLRHEREAAAAEATSALEVLKEQGARHLIWRASLVAAACSQNPSDLERALVDAGRGAPAAIRSEAAVIAASVGVLTAVPRELEDSVESAPESWLPHFRRGLTSPDPATREVNAAFLERYGEFSDVPMLRSFGHRVAERGASKSYGKALARRTAPRLFVRDLGRTHLEIAERSIEVTTVRRKVAALVTYLMTRPGFTAPREQVLEALWPDSPPEVGTNSLHQTVYFLRRDLEPRYSETATPGYVRLEGELIWFDPELVDSASHQFSVLAGSREDGTDSAERAIRLYQGRFAPEFEYEDWAIATREALHAAYLGLVQRTARDLASVGHWGRAAELSRLALAVDPEAEAIERGLIALYESAGSHAAAAEQYSHFAAGHRETYGVEAPPLDEIVATGNRS